MKNTLLLLILLISFNGIAQKLDNKIPNNAQIVFDIKGDKLLELISLDEINNLDFVKKFLKNNDINKLEDYGFDLNKEAFYFNQMIDGRYYNTFIVYLSDSKKYKNQLNSNHKIESFDGVNFTIHKKSGIAWTDNMLILTTISGFNNISSVNSKDIEIEEDAVEYVEEVDEGEVKEKKDKNNITQPEEDAEIVFEDFDDEEVVEVDEGEGNPKKGDIYKSDRILLKKLLKEQVLSVISTKAINSIAKNSSYKSSKKPKASANLWVKDYNATMVNLFGIFSLKKQLFNIMQNQNISGIKSVSSNLFFNKDEIVFTGEFSLTDEMKKRSKKIYNSKLDCDFLKYFNQEDIMAYMSYSINMEAMLHEYPILINNIYGSVLPSYKEEISVASDFLSVFLDEKEIAKLITGDGLFILNDIKEKEVSYTTYEYDNNYKRKEIVKTKKETLPIFTVMLGSENKELLEKVFRLGVKHNVAEENNHIFKYSKKASKSPIDLYLLVQDDILFITNAEQQIINISNKKIKRNIGKHRRLIRKNLASFYVNSDKLINDELPLGMLSPKEQIVVGVFKEDFKEFEFTYKMKHGKIYAKNIIKTNANKTNSLQVLFNLIEKISNL